MRSSIVYYIISFILFLAVQVLFFRNLVLFNYAFCFIYIGFILLLPYETDLIPLMLLGFLLGFITDIFYDSLGIHTAATVFIAFIRPYWVNAITPRGGYEPGAVPGISAMGFQWFTSYSIPLVFVHHLSLFLIEKGNFTMFLLTLLKGISSTVFTFTLLVLFQYLFRSRARV